MTTVIENQCPYCGRINDRASGIIKEDAVPKENDFAVCVGCGGISVFDAAMYQRKATANDLEALYNEDSKAFVMIIEACRYFRKLKQQKQSKEN